MEPFSADDHSRPLVSILICAYGCEPYLDETLSSLAGQTYTNWEAIVIDPDSPDNVAHIARDWQARDPRIRFFQTPDRGVNAARNFAARQSRGEYLMVLDGDDKLAPSYIITCLLAFYNNREENDLREGFTVHVAVFRVGYPHFSPAVHFLRRPTDDQSDSRDYYGSPGGFFTHRRLRREPETVA